MDKNALILIGGGSHAKMVADAWGSMGGHIHAYIDPKTSSWLENLGAQHWQKMPAQPELLTAIGFLGTTIESLKRRLAVAKETNAQFPVIKHSHAIISSSANTDSGVQLHAGSIVNPAAIIGAHSVVNSRAVIEHDAIIGKGVHVAPGAIVLGGATVGDCAYIGAGAVIVQGCHVPAETFVKAGSVWNNSRKI